MKKLRIKRIIAIFLLQLLLVCSSAWSANFSFTDSAGQWWSGSDFSITFDWSAGPVSVTAVGGDLSPNGTGNVEVSLDTDSSSLMKSYSLNAGQIKNDFNQAGPEIAVKDIISSISTVVWADSSDDYFVAWDSSTKTIMIYYGDQSCYTYLGLDFSDDLVWSSSVGGTSITFTASSVEAILGRHSTCSSDAHSSSVSTMGGPSSSVPIPGAIWLLFSGLFGLLFIRRKCRSGI